MTTPNSLFRNGSSRVRTVPRHAQAARFSLTGGAMQSNPVRAIVTHPATPASREHDTLLALADGSTQSWSRLRLRAQLDDDALSDAIEALVARNAVAIVRSRAPSSVSLRITDEGRRELASRALPWSALDGLAHGLELLARQRRDVTKSSVGNPTRMPGESAGRRAGGASS